MSDINVGAITEALNDKMDRDAHNVQSPSAVVVEKMDPTTENNYSWYRKYSDGWVEQGGHLFNTSGSGTPTVSLLLPMANQYYDLFIQTYSSGNQSVIYTATTTTSFTYTGNVGKDSWMAIGYGAV